VIRRLFIPGTVLVLFAVSLSAQVRTISPEPLVSGLVRDSRGTPQIGAMVELLKPDLTVVTETATDDHGRYQLAHIRPGVYELKVSNTFFLPTLRENLQFASSTRLVVNLTLNTLYEAFRWLPAKPRASDEPADDWTWTLRLSANRPLLRMLQDGPLVVMADPDGSRSLKARVTIRGGESAFGDGGVHHDFELARTSDDQQGLILRADLSADPNWGDSPGVTTVAGYEHRLAMDNTLRTVGIYDDRPEIAGAAGNQGLQSFALRNSETLDPLPGVQAEVGDEVRGMSLSDTMVGNYPFASVRVQVRAATLSYQVATAPDAQRAAEADQYTNLSSAASEVNGRLVSEHGLHQQLGVSVGNPDHTVASVSVYHDHLLNPIVTAGGGISNAELNGGDLLYDPITELLSASGQGFSSTGVLAELRDNVGGGVAITFDAATGNAIAYFGDGSPAPLAQQLSELRSHTAQMLAAATSGKLPKAGTQWKVAYRWQTGGTLTPVAPFATEVSSAFLSLYLRQPIHYRRVLPNGIEALVDVRNLLAQGYRPFLTSDGSTLYFAQVDRCVEGGLSFSF
jgi:Carboxypeptidase regulatory-like domain